MFKSWLLGATGFTNPLAHIIMFAADNDKGGGGSTNSDDPPADNDDDPPGDDDDDESDDDNDDNGDDDDNDDETDSKNDKRTIEQKIKQGKQNLIDRFGGNTAAAFDHLYRERFRDREQRRTDRRTIAELQRQVPGRGRVVLSQQDAGELREYRALGKPKDIRTLKENVTTLQTKEAARQREDTLKSVAEAVGYNFDVLKDVGGTLRFQVDTKTEDGKTVKTAYVVDAADRNKRTEVTAYAKEHWSHHLPSLTGASTRGNGTGQQSQSSSVTAKRRVALQAGANERSTSGSSSQGGTSNRVLSRYKNVGPKTE
jgi:hypothetical protein